MVKKVESGKWKVDNEFVIGVLALQGNFEEHKVVLDDFGMNTIFVRSKEDLQAIDALIIPGGESTVMMKLLNHYELTTLLQDRVRSGMPVFGTCAGVIVLAQLGLLDVTVDRNAYGSQLHSFSAQVEIDGIGALEADFIRAPKIVATKSNVEVLGSYEAFPVAVQQGNVIGVTFHTETRKDVSLHKYFLERLPVMP